MGDRSADEAGTFTETGPRCFSMIARQSQGKTTSPLAVRPMGMQLPWLFPLTSSARASDSDIAESTTTKAANFIAINNSYTVPIDLLISRPPNYVSAMAFVGKMKTPIHIWRSAVRALRESARTDRKSELQ